MAQEAAPIGKFGLSAEEDELVGVMQLDQPSQKQSTEELAQGEGIGLLEKGVGMHPA